MDILRKYRSMGALFRLDPAVTYLPWWGRTATAMVIGPCLVLFGLTSAGIHYLWHHETARLLTSIVISTITAWMAIQAMHYLTRLLDAYSTWHHSFARRLYLQLTIATLLPFVFFTSLDLWIIHQYGPGIAASGYLRFDLWFILSIMCLYNFIYTVWYYRAVPATKSPPAAPKSLPIYDGSSYIDIPLDQVLLIIRSADKGKVYLKDRPDWVKTKLRAPKLLDLLDQSQYYYTHRRYFIHGSIILNVETNKSVDTRNDVRHVTTIEFGNPIIGIKRKTLVKGSVTEFRTWYENYCSL